MPALFVTGQLDPNSTPEMSRRMAEEAPRGQALVVADERHMMPFVAPEKINPLLRDFLSMAYIEPAAALLVGENTMSASVIDPLELRKALGTFVTGVTIITTIDEAGTPRGFTANSFTSVSLDPPLLLVCLAKSAFSYSVFASAQQFAVNILAEHQREASRIFASKIPDRFARVDWRQGSNGSPILSDSAAWFECCMHDTVDAGDHIILIGRVMAFEHSTASPLGYCRGNYLTFGLEQEAVAAPGQKTRVGVILEQNGQVLLLEDKAGTGCKLPTGTSLGRTNDAESLYRVVKALGVEADIGFLFAVFEDGNTGTLSVYYRGDILSATLADDTAMLVDFDAIPWDKLPDKAVRTMLQRYVSERLEDQFGIYVGDFSNGTVHVLHKK